MNDPRVVAARSILCGVIGLALTLFILVMTLFVTHDQPVIVPSLVMAVTFAVITIYNLVDLRGMR